MSSRIKKLPTPDAVKEMGVDIWLLDTDRLNATENDFALLSKGEQYRCTELKNEESRQQFVVTRSMLRQLLAEKLSCAPKEIKFFYTEAKRPVIDYPITRLNFSVSHSRDMSLFVLSENNPVGIDIENNNKDIDPLTIAETVFSRREIKRLMSCDQVLRHKLFYRIWTIKESLLKMLGVGFLIDPRSVCVDHVLGENTLINLHLEKIAESFYKNNDSFPEKAEIIELSIDAMHTATLALGHAISKVSK